MNHISFNPNRKELTYDGNVHKNVITIKENQHYYEVIFRDGDVSKPLFRFPIIHTVIRYSYE
jgi:hypothetical protein